MYEKYLVVIPLENEGGTVKKIKGVRYVYYTFDRNYSSEKHYTVPKATTIGKCDEATDGMDFLVEVPDEKGKIITKKKSDAIYVNYEVGREYYPDRQYIIPKRMIIGKLSKVDKGMMVPNQNFLIYFLEVELPEENFNSNRSSCLKIGTYIVIQKSLEEYKIPELLERQFEGKDLEFNL
ncbi:hypothetical protein [Butyrivibrio sp. TB]|uniref:hypothetical protein n=1 Tax=Butyrivibrio sp. TB TaxID=1520809 RepID=UPI0008CE8532|nr:hypothetical protein [Butyrivibrio sp. TB]SEQ64657.1 hypothetical protein SAMN02910382_03664 [Butyrivibrio sp. TB]